jgi:hypothetical protein
MPLDLSTHLVEASVTYIVIHLCCFLFVSSDPSISYGDIRYGLNQTKRGIIYFGIGTRGGCLFRLLLPATVSSAAIAPLPLLVPVASAATKVPNRPTTFSTI